MREKTRPTRGVRDLRPYPYRFLCRYPYPYRFLCRFPFLWVPVWVPV